MSKRYFNKIHTALTSAGETASMSATSCAKFFTLPVNAAWRPMLSRALEPLSHEYRISVNNFFLPVNIKY